MWHNVVWFADLNVGSSAVSIIVSYTQNVLLGLNCWGMVWAFSLFLSFLPFILSP